MMSEVKPTPATGHKVPKVLVADDDDYVREVLVRHLQQDGYRVEEACDGAEAIAAIESGEFVHLVLTDVRMPGNTGIDVMRAAKKKSRDTEVIVMTAYTDCASAIEAVREGAYDYLQKPFAYVGDVSTKIKRALREQQLEFTNREMLGRLEELNVGLKDVLVRRTREANDARTLLSGTAPRIPPIDIDGLAERMRAQIEKIDQAASEIAGDAGARLRVASAALRLEIETARVAWNETYGAE